MSVATDRQAPSPWTIVAWISIPVFLGSLDLTVVTAFLPTLLSELGLTLNAEGLANVSWILTSYLLAYSVSLFAVGRLSDVIGRRRALTICLALYIVGSLLVVFYTIPAEVLDSIYSVVGIDFDDQQVTVQAIVLARMIAAFGAGAITSIAIALVSDLFSSDKAAVPLGVVMAIDTLGWLIGAAWGGIVIQVLSWKAIFLINMPVVLVVLVLMWRLLGRVERKGTSGRFDLGGFLLLSLVLICLNVGFANLTAGGEGVNLTITAPALGIGAVLLMAFVAYQLRVVDPLIAPAMFRARGVSAATTTNLLVGFCMFIPLIGIPLLVNVRGLSEIGFGAVIPSIREVVLQDASFESGLLMAAFTVPIALASVLGGWLLDRIGSTRVMMTGLALAAIGYALIGTVLTITTSNLNTAFLMILSGAGIGLTFSPVITTILRAVAGHRRGMASALVLGIRMVGMTIATSTISAYSGQRITDLVEATEAGRFLIDVVSPDYYAQVFSTTYINTSVQTLNEMALIGLGCCILAIVVVVGSGVRARQEGKNAEVANLEVRG